MKKQVRVGVFETNSSSTHSVSISDTSIAESVVTEKLMEALKKLAEEGYQYDNNIADMLDGNKLTLNGFYEESGGESGLVAHIIKNPIFKIEYLFGILLGYVSNKYYYIKDENAIGGINGNLFGYRRRPETLNEPLFLERTEEYKFFKEAVINYLKTNEEYAHITDVEICQDRQRWEEVSWFDENDDVISTSMFESKDKFLSVFNDIMQDGRCILLTDTPYSMYDKPKMYVF